MFSKENRWIIFLISIIGICLANSIIRICYSLPLYDEVFFADITHNLIINNSINSNILLSPLEASIYGPVYFYAQKTIISILGFGMWQFRILNFLSGGALIFFFIVIARKLNISKINICILIALIAFDSQLLFNMTSGRMDLFALALFMCGWLLFREIEKRTYFLIIISGIISSLSFLSTPRIGFYFLAYIFTFVSEVITSNKRNKMFIQYLVFCLSILIPVLCWIFYSYGDLSNYINFIFKNPAIKNHYGGTIFPVNYQIPIIVLWFISGLYVFKSKANILNPLLLSLFSFPLLHLIFIKEVGPYSAMLMSFIYTGIIIGIEQIPRKEFSIIPGAVAIYLFLGILSSTLSNLASLGYTNPDPFNTFLKSQEIKKELVLADFPFYYFLTENGNRFISFYNTKNDLTENSLNKSNIEFAVITKENYNKNFDLFNKLGFKVISEYNSINSFKGFYKVAIFLKRNIITGYDGFILKRKLGNL